VRILYFINGLHPGGKERRLLELLKYVITHNYAEVELALMSTEIRYPEVHSLGIKINYLIRRFKKDPGIFYHLYKLCKSFKPDIIHAWDSMTAVYTAPIVKLSGVKFINGMIVGAPERMNPLHSQWIRSRISFPFSDVIVANSFAGLKAYNAPGSKSVCIYNGFDNSRISRLTNKDIIRKKFDIHTVKIVGMVGEFSKRKDFESYILAAQKVVSMRDDVSFLTVGDGETLEKCKSMIVKQKTRNIKFLGWQSDVESIINVMDVGVLSTYTEGMSNSILEYMALGKPVVATDGGGTNEIVVDGVTGFLVPRGNIEVMAKKINALLDDNEGAKNMGDQGSQRVADLFSLDTMGSRYIDIYRKISLGIKSSSK